MRFEKHHVLWTRAEWSQTPLSKRVRQMSAFIIDIPYINHRLLHASMRPPRVPPRDTLLEMEQLALQGIFRVQETLEHHIATHIGRQLLIAYMEQDEAYEMLENRAYNIYDINGERDENYRNRDI